MFLTIPVFKEILEMSSWANEEDKQIDKVNTNVETFFSFRIISMNTKLR